MQIEVETALHDSLMRRQVYYFHFHYDARIHEYVLDSPIPYFSARYKKMMTAMQGLASDGATGGEDIVSIAWWIHDQACKRGTWDDGTTITRMQAAWLLYDALIEEGRWYRARTWWLATGPLATILYGNKLPRVAASRGV